jgi:streptogramin lyase
MSRKTGRLLSATLAAGLVLSMGGAALAAPVGMLKQFKVPTAQSEPIAITDGSDGNRWFTEGNGNTPSPAELGRITANGTITEFAANCNFCLLTDVVQGPNSILYMTSNGSDFLRFDQTAGTFLPVLTSPNSGSAQGIARAGNNIWFLAGLTSLVRFNTTTSQFAEFPIGVQASDVAVDGANGYFTDDFGQTITKFDTATGAVIQTFDVSPLTPRAVTVATDHQVWFTSDSPVGVGRLDPANGAVTPFPTPSLPRRPLDIAAGPGGAIWFTQDAKGNIARIDNSGAITETKVVKGTDPTGIVVAPNGDPWFTMRFANKIGAFQLR